MGTAILLKDFKKSYGSNQVIKGISLEIEKGETFALLGTNGAGKTTTLECMEGLKKYQGGEIVIDGKIGIQLQSASLPATIKAIEAMQLFANWNHAEVNQKQLEALGVASLSQKQYGGISTGQKRRLHLAMALIGDPDIIFLDEPTAGLDVEGRAALHQEIRALKGMGKTIVLASHDMAEVEELCDRIAILREGRIAFLGTARDLTAHMGSSCMIHLKTKPGLEDRSWKHCNYQGMKQGYQIFRAADISSALLELLQEAQEQGKAVVDLRVEHASLEQRFLEINKEER